VTVEDTAAALAVGSTPWPPIGDFLGLPLGLFLVSWEQIKTTFKRSTHQTKVK